MGWSAGAPQHRPTIGSTSETATGEDCSECNCIRNRVGNDTSTGTPPSIGDTCFRSGPFPEPACERNHPVMPSTTLRRRRFACQQALSFPADVRTIGCSVAVAVAVAVASTFVSPTRAFADPVTGPSVPQTAPRVTNAPGTPTRSPSRAPKTQRTPKTRSAPLSGFGQGAKGQKVIDVQTRLQELHYDITDVSGAYGDQTYHAVMAFQKVNGLTRTGRVTDATLAALGAASDPAPQLPTGGADRIEVDLQKQFLALYRGGALTKLLSISSGSGKDFCVLDPDTNKTACDTAITPGGSFRVRSRFLGWRESKLGLLYNPLYFNGGIAIHGAPSVPGSPASHGCVRIPMVSAEWFPTEVPNGTPVYVFGGENRPVPLNAKAPSDTSPGVTLLPGSPTTTPRATVVSSVPATTTSTIGDGARLLTSTTAPSVPTTPATTTQATTTQATTTTIRL